MRTLKILIILLFPVLLPFIISCDDVPIAESDTASIQNISYFDLRERDSFVQITNISGGSINVHFQIFDTSNDCNENNFYDTLTGNDTHVYNMKDITTNNGNPSGVVLPEGAYGFVVVTVVEGVGGLSVPTEEGQFIIGNFRIIDNKGYEYRTNAPGFSEIEASQEGDLTFNYNSSNGISFSDIIGIIIENPGSGFSEVIAADVIDANLAFDIDIYNLDEVPFSCRNIIFACINQESPRYQGLLEQVGEASVAGLEYGINEVIPGSKNAPLLCPGNNIPEGIVKLDLIGELDDEFFVGFVGVNNGNGRGSMDSFWSPTLDSF